MARRCFSEIPISGSPVALAGSEAHHLLHVLRAAPGMDVVLFDGSGAEFDAVVLQCRRSTVELQVIRRRLVDRELRPPLTLGVTMPKGDRQRWIVEKAVELGVTQLVPLVTERSEKLGGEKLGRYVVEANKQCGRNRLMEIAKLQAWREWLHRPAARGGMVSSPATRRWIAHPTGRPLTAGDLSHDRPALIAIGPEGGLSDEETAEAVAAGWELIGLGPRLLRIETAAIGLVAAMTFSTFREAAAPAVSSL